MINKAIGICVVLVSSMIVDISIENRAFYDRMWRNIFIIVLDSQ